MLCSLTASAIFSTPLGWHTPMMTRPWSLYLSISSLVCGTDWMHGPHHVAQKSTSTTLPLSLSNVIGSALIHLFTASAGGALPSNCARRARLSASPSSHSGLTALSPAAGPPAARSDFSSVALSPSVGLGVSARSFSTTSSTRLGTSPIARTLPARSTTAYVGYHCTLNALAALFER